MIYQDPISSLNPRRRVAEIVGEGLAIWGRRDGAAERVASMLRDVGIDPDAAGRRRPHEFSGGQCQRICIARSLVLDPTVLICDEPVSALDVSVQAQILNLLEDLKASHGLTMLFIAHDLAVVRNVSDRVAVMYLGKLCEVGPADALYARPAHPYTAALIDAVPEPDPDVPASPDALQGDLPSPIAPPSGCRFRTRCPRATDRCAAEEPVLRPVGGDGHAAGHVVAGHSWPATSPWWTSTDPVASSLSPASGRQGRRNGVRRYSMHLHAFLHQRRGITGRSGGGPRSTSGSPAPRSTGGSARAGCCGPHPLDLRREPRLRRLSAPHRGRETTEPLPVPATQVSYSRA